MKIIILLIFGLLLNQALLILPDETRNKFLRKYAKEISPDIITEEILDLEANSISYDKQKIEDLIKKYNFPQSYDFINETDPILDIKDQKSCGCCWAMAATTCLAYRYHKKGIEVDFSPQHELSCYMRTCKGNTGIDAQLSLIKNGTVTEECFPFSSGNSKIEECPINSCKNPEVEYKKYFAKNAYYIGITKNNFYDVTTLIIDQLITKGPVVTQITAYDDFQHFGNDTNCINNVYTYDGISGNPGGHALSLIGYGFLNDKYYWLIQNSWGEKWCQGGIAKIEFGQVGVGTVFFSEPYLEEEESPEIINITYGKIDSFCNLEIKANNLNLDNWKSQLNIIFNHVDGLKEFDYICGINKLITENETKIYCNYEFQNKVSYKGLYEYKTFQSIGKENTFSLDESFKNINFTYYGFDSLETFSSIIKGINLYHFVSEKGSRITFFYKPVGIDKNMTSILANVNHDIPLSNCKQSTFSVEENVLSYCDMNEAELNYFDDYSTKSGNKMLLRCDCGGYYYQNLITYKLDKTKYPVFRIKHFVASFNKNESKISLMLYSNVEGSLSSYNENKNSIMIFADVMINNKSDYYLSICPIGSPRNIGPDYIINCSLDYSKSDKIDKVYLYPYTDIYNFETPFEVIISDIMENEDYIPPDPSPMPTFSKYLRISSILMALLFYYLF